MRRRYGRFLIGVISVAVLYMAVCAALLYKLPSEVRLTEYTTHELSFDVPFTATIQQEAVAVLKVNDQPLADPMYVSLNTPLTIETDAAGAAEMTINLFGLPVKKVAVDVVPDVEVVPCGMTIGVCINTQGVMVLGTSSFKDDSGMVRSPCDGRLKPGDLILKANGLEMKSQRNLTEAIDTCQNDVTFEIKRDGETLFITVTPYRAAKDGINRIGVWVRDSTKGIGTITYFDPATGGFGALGHGIMDVDTRRLISVKDGVIMASRVTSVKKGAKGSPGELEGAVDSKRVLGQITSNSPYGIYGSVDITQKDLLPTETVKVATQSQIHEGPAVIRTNVATDTVKEYDIFIENVNRFTTDDTKGMVIRITDPELLRLTNGIVQGMSGSPILQDGRLVGAVTHVFVQDPAKGYGIFIESMLKQERQLH